MTPTRTIDTAPLQRLLQISGPREAPKLVAALLQDLSDTATNLELAWNGPDFAALRTNTHVMIALAGTIGDTDLHALALLLNGAAHRESLSDIMEMKPEIMAFTADLISAVSRHSGAGD